MSRLLRLALVLASVAPAQALAHPFAPGHAAAQDSDAQVRADIAFARGLAADLGFTDIAEQVLSDLEQNAPAKMAVELGLVKCQIYHAGARSERSNPERSRELYEKALTAYEEFIDAYPYEELAQAAEAEFIDVTSEYGRMLARMIEEATGEEAVALREQLQERLSAAVVRTGDIAEGLRAISEPTESEKIQLYELLLNRANMLLELAKAQEEGDYHFSESLSTYEELALAAGEDSPWGLQAYAGMGNNYLAQGQFRDAADFFTFVCDRAIPKKTEDRTQLLEGKLDWQGGVPPSAADLEQRFLFVQLGIGGAVEALRKAGKTGEACDWGLYFYNVYNREGLTLHESGLGHQAFLAVGQTLLEAGGYVGGELRDGGAQWFATREEMEQKFSRPREQRTAAEVALGIAETVNQEMRGTVLQVRAQKLIAEVISLPGMKPDPGIMFQAAQGEYYSRNSGDAVAGFKRLLAMLEGTDQATRLEFGPKTLYFLGRTYRRDGLHMQAIVTYQEALENWPDDPEYSRACANDMLASAGTMRRADRTDPLLEQIYKEAENWVLVIGGDDTEDIKFRNALAVFEGREPDFQDAMAKFQEVGPGASSYEKALVYVAISAFKLKDFDQAEKLLAQYLESYVQDPKNAVTSNRERARRDEARAMAKLYRGLNATLIATTRKGGDDDELWGRVVQLLQGYEDEFPEQTSFASVAMHRRMLAHLQLDQTEEALAVQAKLTELFPDERSTAAASTDAYKILAENREAVEDPAEKEALLEKMARLLRISNDGARSLSYTNLRRESTHWLELGDHAQAERVLRTLVAEFSDDEQYGDSIAKHVLPDLGLTLMQQEKVEAAAEVLGTIVAAGNASLAVARNWALCLTGWPRFSGQTFDAIVPGVAEDSKAFAQATDELIKIVNTVEVSNKWNAPWYQAKFDLAFGYWRWGAIDSAKLASARGQLSNLLVDLGGEDFPVIEDESIRAQWKWLWKKLE